MDICRYCKRAYHTIDFCPILRCTVCGLQGHRSLKCKMKQLRNDR